MARQKYESEADHDERARGDRQEKERDQESWARKQDEGQQVQQSHATTPWRRKGETSRKRGEEKASGDRKVRLEPNGNGVPFGWVSAATGFKRPNE